LNGTTVQTFYRYQACIYDWTRWTILHGRKRAAARLDLHPESQVLEVGCGTGLSFQHILAQLDPHRGRLVGVDFSPQMLRQAAKRVTARGWPNVELLNCDASTMKLRREFDGIFFAYALTMIPDWIGALDRARAHLKVGGRLVVLDFGKFAGWGPLAPLMRGWLRFNHVETLRPCKERLREVFPNLEVEPWLADYNYIAVGTRSK